MVLTAKTKSNIVYFSLQLFLSSKYNTINHLYRYNKAVLIYNSIFKIIDHNKIIQVVYCLI